VRLAPPADRNAPPLDYVSQVAPPPAAAAAAEYPRIHCKAPAEQDQPLCAAFVSAGASTEPGAMAVRTLSPSGCLRLACVSLCRSSPTLLAAAAAVVSHLCACIGSPCLRRCVHGAPIGGGGGGHDEGGHCRDGAPAPLSIVGRDLTYGVVHRAHVWRAKSVRAKARCVHGAVTGDSARPRRVASRG
jgi:hypothetical protein